MCNNECYACFYKPSATKISVKYSALFSTLYKLIYIIVIVHSLLIALLFIVLLGCLLFPLFLLQSINMNQIAIFATGAGSNANKIIHHFKHHSFITVALVVCNKPGAGVINIANQNNIPVLMIEKEPFFKGNHYIKQLQEHNIDFIILAGFLWKIPDALIETFPERILNIHPALLPLYGGKGMYGNLVHQAVIEAGEKQTGITIHVVDEKYDNGRIIFTATCPVFTNDTPELLAQRIHVLEHKYYPDVIEKYVADFSKN